MGPIETLFLTIQILIAVVGVVRGYAKELGNTLVFMAAIFFLSYVGERALEPLNATANQGFCTPGPVPPQWDVVGPFGSFFTTTFGIPPGSEQLNTILFLVYVGAFLAIVFASYAGRTLDFRGRELRAPEGTILSMLIGLLNGYLVAGTIWYYAALFGYPGMNVVETFSSTACFMLTYLPQEVVTNPVAWMVPVALLILLRVRG